MAAYADDLRYFYSEDLSDVTEEVAVNGVASAKSTRLEPGRYIARVGTLVADPTLLWLKQGDWDDVVAEDSVPSTPFMIGGTLSRAVDLRALNEPLLTFMVRASDREGLAGILNSHTTTASFEYNDNGGAGDSQIIRTVGSFVGEGYAVGEVVQVSGTALNDGLYTIKTVAVLILTLDGLVLADEGPLSSTLKASGTSVVTITKISRDLR
jgi:hypothetical protein